MSDSKRVISFDEKKIDAIFADLDQCHLPGVAVGISKGGNPVYRKGFGLASMELPVVLSSTIRMRIGSVTKHFAAFAYMLLCEEGKAGVDDPIGKYLPNLHPVVHRVTVRQLMGHISGVRDVTDIKFRFSGLGGRPIPSSELLALYRDIDDLDAEPGTCWIYNNGGYLLVSAVIERIAGQPLEQVLSERIFAPVGMHNTLLRRWDTDFVPNSAVTHTMTLAGNFERRYWGLDFAGAGGMVSTVDDLLRWLAHMDEPVVGSPETWSAMKAPMILANGSSTGYSMGLMTGEYRGVDVLHHGGGWMGGNAQMLKVPSFDLDVVIVANRADAFAPLLVNRVLDRCLPGLDPIEEESGPLSTGAFSALRVKQIVGTSVRGSAAAKPGSQFSTGTFRSLTTSRVLQLFEKDGRQIVSIDGHDLPYVRRPNGELHPIPIWSYLKQIVTPIGPDLTAPVSVRLNDFGNLDELVSVQPISAENDRAILGSYRSDSARIEAEIDEGDDGLRLHTIGPFGSLDYSLHRLADDIWRVDSPISMFLVGIVSFERDAAGFRLSSYNTRSLRFRRVA
jgi:D-aminopeptidase